MTSLRHMISEDSIQQFRSLADISLSTSVHRRTMERIMRYVLDSNPRHAKFAARLLAFSKNREKTCNEVIEVIVSRIELDASTEVFSQSIADRLSDANPEH